MAQYNHIRPWELNSLYSVCEERTVTKPPVSLYSVSSSTADIDGTSREGGGGGMRLMSVVYECSIDIEAVYTFREATESSNEIIINNPKIITRN